MSLPVLDPRFFTEHQPSANFFQKWKEKATWNEALLPVYEWEGCLFIAVDAKTYNETLTAQFPFPHVLVLANAEEMKKTWLSFQSKAKADSPLNSKILLKTDELIPPPAHIKLEDDPFAALEQASSLRKDDETLFDSAEPSLDSESTAVATATNPEEALELSIEPPPMLNPEFISLEPSKEEVAVTEVTVSKSTQTPTSIEPAAKLDSNNWTESFFDKLNSHFPYSMIFLVNNHQAMPWKWSATLSSKNPSALDMTKPSPFYVVDRTQQSYHGPIADSAEIRKLCADWGFKNYPQHMTVSPIKINDRITMGVLVAFGEAEHYQPANLQLCETCAKEIAEIIQEKPELLKAA